VILPIFTDGRLRLIAGFLRRLVGLCQQILRAPYSVMP
jgi:hypothetical protein